MSSTETKITANRDAMRARAAGEKGQPFPSSIRSTPDTRLAYEDGKIIPAQIYLEVAKEYNATKLGEG
jgi:hypothetical protein